MTEFEYRHNEESALPHEVWQREDDQEWTNIACFCCYPDATRYVELCKRLLSV